MIYKAYRQLILLLFLLASFFSANAAEKASLDAGMVNPGYEEKPSWFKQSFLDIREDVDEAGQEGKRLLLYFYQDGCPYCAKLLRDNFGQRDIALKTQKYFNVVAINMWGDREVIDLKGTTITEKQFASDLKVMFTPTLMFLDEQARVVLRVNGYFAPDKFTAALDYVGQKHELKRVAFRDYYNKHKPVASSGKLHKQPFLLSAPYDLKQLCKNEKPLMVLFEQKKCKTCDELHDDVFKRKETLHLLKRFNVVRFDMWDKTPLIAPNGKKTTADKFARSLDVKYAPTMVFFDGSGKEAFRAEAYLRAFHVQSIMDYVASGAYKLQPNFQRFISARADKLEAQGIHVDIWK